MQIAPCFTFCVITLLMQISIFILKFAKTLSKGSRETETIGSNTT
jgi:hypothetical protein